MNAAILKELGQQGLPNLCFYFKNTEWNVGIGKTTGNEVYYYILKKKHLLSTDLDYFCSNLELLLLKEFDLIYGR